MNARSSGRLRGISGNSATETPMLVGVWAGWLLSFTLLRLLVVNISCVA